jgi:hypothetical protein
MHLNRLIREYKKMRTKFRALLIEKSGAKVQIKFQHGLKSWDNFKENSRLFHLRNIVHGL